MNTPDIKDATCSADQYLFELQRQSEHAKRLVSGMTAAQLNWRPEGGQAWSVAQCIEHLSATNRIYLASLYEVAEPGSGQPASDAGVYRPGGWLTRRFITSMEPPPKQKFGAFRKIQPASTEYQGEAVLSVFLAEQEKLAAFVTDRRQIDLGTIRFWNPFLKGMRFTVSSGLLLIGAHNRRHLWQAEQVKKHESFPN